MFVPHDPNRIFDIKRYGDRCVCGASAVVTSSSGYDNGYCSKCSGKRDKFVSRIVGNIDVYANKKETELALILEQIRKRTIQERIYYLIDKWFAGNNNSLQNYKEPYNDELFLINCFHEKNEATNTLFHHLVGSDSLPDDEYQSQLLRTSYYNEVVNMWHSDDKKISLLLLRYGDNKKPCIECDNILGITTKDDKTLIICL